MSQLGYNIDNNTFKIWSEYVYYWRISVVIFEKCINKKYWLGNNMPATTEYL